MSKRLVIAALFAAMLMPFSPPAHAAETVDEVMSAVVTRLYAEKSPEELAALDEETVRGLFTGKDREILANRYWTFDVDVPVVVSVMRDRAQETVPFWLGEGGFKKTDLRVRNSEYQYEVWRKEFPAGRVGLGINGFDKNRPHYFVAVGPQKKGARLKVTPVFPEKQQLLAMKKGATIYHDWPDLVLTTVPKELEGQVLLPTIRGRAREAHLLGGFRLTKHPAATAPDQVMLTWSGDPQTTQTIQWRAAETVAEGVVRYREKDGVWAEAAAEIRRVEDRNLANDRYVNRFTATLTGLKPGTEYEYVVRAGAEESASAVFNTAPAGDTPFSFVWMSDTHCSPESGELLAAAGQRHPEASFLVVSGDLVGTGQYRDDWDKLFSNFAPFIKSRPFMPSIGNHDAIDGLGAELYLSLFELPKNGPPATGPEQSYRFQYGNTLILSLDVTAPLEPQAEWIEETLRASNATWKIAVLHFPPYFPDESDMEVRRAWCGIFEKNHVDLVLSGHTHNYVRTKPLHGGKPVVDPKDGTIYLVTVSVPGRPVPNRTEKFTEYVDFSGKPFYHLFTVDGETLVSRSMNLEGKICDELVLKKPGKVN